MAEGLLAPALAKELLQRQERLQADASRVLDDLDLLALLSRAGDPVVVGSTAMGLMALPDIDVSVECDTWNADVIFQVVRRLASHPRVRRLNYDNRIGALNPGFAYDGYYWGVQYRSERAVEWKLDLWFWRRGATPGNREYSETLRQRLTPATRLAILWIKHSLLEAGRYGKYMRSIDVYAAVLDHGVRTPAAFDAYIVQLSSTGRPTNKASC